MRKSKNIGKTINGYYIIDSECVNNRTYYIMKCTFCGNELKRACSSVCSGQAKCKCQYIPRKKTTDQTKKERLYNVYYQMICRTTHVNHYLYQWYGAKGIKICDEWLNDYQAFKKWAYENGYDDKAPKGKCTIDRINVKGDYEPSNCRWITLKEQAKNKSTTRIIDYDNKKQCLKDWAKDLDISYPTFVYLINKGKNIKEIIEWKNRRMKDEIKKMG